ncbi:MAG: guanylate kinase [Thermoanaerobaculia bacterium]|nr:guanylate kinase [Thermoanaerobaculia bacterium]
MSSDSSPEHRGGCYVVTAASGTGKSTVLRELFENHREAMADVTFSISHTSRPPREGEVEGRHYYFISEDEFRRLADGGAFLEWALVHGQYKGTSLAEVERLRSSGRDVLLEIDVQGTAQVRHKIPEAVSIFLLPPSYPELERRLRDRNLDSQQQIERRLADAAAELPRVQEFDYVIVNDDVGRAAHALAAVLLAGRHRRDRMRPVTERILASLPTPPPGRA